MVRDRGRRTLIAAVITLGWLGYMVVGLALINTLLPSEGGEGPAGTAAFVGLVWGVAAMGTIMWAASD